MLQFKNRAFVKKYISNLEIKIAAIEKLFTLLLHSYNLCFLDWIYIPHKSV